jgi:MYXO-CTERM domain-containing protein
MLILSLTFLASAGYGDAVNGLPSPHERALVLWTNAARVAPGEFKAEYEAGGCSFEDDFTEDERTPKAPYLWNADLAEAAVDHTADMHARAFFSHTSSDGTSMGERVSSYYDGSPIGENIASGQASPYTAVFQAWMCSTKGHRGAIMSGGFDEIGTGVVATLYTQDFGHRGLAPRGIAMGMGRVEAGRVVFRGDWEGEPPDAYSVVWNGRRLDMNPRWGTPSRGVYAASFEPELGDQTALGETDCDQWYLEAVSGDRVVRFPEDGSYGFGDCPFADAPAQWLPSQLPIEDDAGGCGCSSTGGGGGGLLVLALGLLTRRRRRP